MRELTIPDFKLKFIKREPELKKIPIGLRQPLPSPHTFKSWIQRPAKLSDPEPVPEHLTLALLKEYPKLFLCEILKSRLYQQDHKSMKQQFRKTTNCIPATNQRLRISGYSWNDANPIKLLDITPTKNLKAEYFDTPNDSNSCYEELIVSMIKNECTTASFKII